MATAVAAITSAEEYRQLFLQREENIKNLYITVCGIYETIMKYATTFTTHIDPEDPFNHDNINRALGRAMIFYDDLERLSRSCEYGVAHSTQIQELQKIIKKIISNVFLTRRHGGGIFSAETVIHSNPDGKFYYLINILMRLSGKKAGDLTYDPYESAYDWLIKHIPYHDGPHDDGSSGDESSGDEADSGMPDG